MTRRLFFQHIVNRHLFDQLMAHIPKPEKDGVTKCPYQDCKFESRSPDQRPMLYHYSIIHEIVHKKFDSMFPNHFYGTKNKA